MGSWKFVFALTSVLLAAACAPSEHVASSAGPRNQPQLHRSEDKAEDLIGRYPSVISGPFGVSKTSAYKRVRHDSVNARAFSGNSGVLIDNSNTFSVPPAPREMAALSRLVIKGKVVGLGLPHFNSSDGSFWDPALHEEPGKVDIASGVFRDVVFSVSEVWGNRLSNEIETGSLIRFTSRGGQIAVTIPEDVAKKLELEGPGVHVYSEEAPVNLRVGEEAILFLNERPLEGLYNRAYGYRFELFPAYEAGYKYVDRGNGMVGIELEGSVEVGTSHTLLESELRELVKVHLGENAGPEPKPGFFPAEPHPETEGGSPPTEKDEPEHTHGEGG